MNKKRLVVPLFVFPALFASVMFAKPSNVLLIMPDDLSYDDFSFANHQPDAPRTPHIDRLAKESVRLTDFHVAPTCSPTRAALMTGRDCDATGVWHTIMGRYFLREDEVTMAEVFKANGYRTALFSKWHLGDNYPFRPKDRGFEHVVMIHGGGVDQQPDYWGNRNTVPCVLYENDQPVQLTDQNGQMLGERDKPGIPGAFTTDYFTTQTIAYMQGCRDKQEPFFAYLPYNVAHGPDDMPADARNRVDAHTATIENLDKNVGRLLTYLDQAGLTENTLLLFMTDNGMASFMLRGGKGSEYEGGHRVPCFIRWPAGGYAGTPAGAREVPALAGVSDLLPTLMDVLGLHDVPLRTPEVAITGHSLKTLLDPNLANDDPALTGRILVVDNQRMDHLVKYKQACVMQDERDATGRIVHKWRMVRAAEAKAWELFDLQTDLREKTNLVTKEPPGRVLGSLQAAYESWWQRINLRSAEYCRPILGTAAAPATCLYAHDWHTEDDVPWNQTMIASGMASNGFHAVSFEHVGSYTFDLRRWPREIAGETTVAFGLRTPLRVTQSNALTHGKALPVRAARIRIWHDGKTYADERQVVNPDSSGPVFTLKLPAGPATVQTWFYDVSGQELCGAYYVYVSAAAGAGQP